MADPLEMRIGTAEREEAVAVLGDHFSAGRLTLVEFDDRVALAMEARTRGDLAPLFDDLPSAPAWLTPPAARENILIGLVTLLPFVFLAFLLILVLRHPIAILIALGVLYMVGRRGYRLLTDYTGTM